MNNELILAIAETWSPPGGRGLVPDVKGRMVLALKQLENEHIKETAQLRAELEEGRKAMLAYCEREAEARADNEALRGRLERARSLIYDLVLYARKAPGSAQACQFSYEFLKGSELPSPPATEPRVEAVAEDCDTCIGPGNLCEEHEADDDEPAPASAQGTTEPGTLCRHGQGPSHGGNYQCSDGCTFHRCTGCEWFIDTTYLAEERITELVHEHLVRDHGARPDTVLAIIEDRVRSLERGMAAELTLKGAQVEALAALDGRVAALEACPAIHPNLNRQYRRRGHDVDSAHSAGHGEFWFDPTPPSVEKIPQRKSAEPPQPAPVERHAFKPVAHGPDNGLPGACWHPVGGEPCGQPRSAAVHGGAK